MLVKPFSSVDINKKHSHIKYGYTFNYDEINDCYSCDIPDKEALNLIGLGWVKKVKENQAKENQVKKPLKTKGV